MDQRTALDLRDNVAGWSADRPSGRKISHAIGNLDTRDRRLVGRLDGLLIPMYSADPARRAQQLIFTSEDLRTFLDEWERIWFLDQPSHMKPIRTHGGII
jgi:hypothetical protein